MTATIKQIHSNQIIVTLNNWNFSELNSACRIINSVSKTKNIEFHVYQIGIVDNKSVKDQQLIFNEVQVVSNNVKFANSFCNCLSIIVNWNDLKYRIN